MSQELSAAALSVKLKAARLLGFNQVRFYGKGYHGGVHGVFINKFNGLVVLADEGKYTSFHHSAQYSKEVIEL